MNRQFVFAACAGLAVALALSTEARAKPIAFAHGATLMAEYGAGSMEELQLFYAPRYFLSAGLGHLSLDSDIDGRTRDITYARINYLARRWNQEAAQANAFVWGGAGRASVKERGDDFAAWNAGAQFDYETRRIYSSLKSDFYSSAAFSHRIDTLQLGVAPYEHDYATLATWFVAQARRYTGEIHEGTEWALLLRLFKRGAWIEAGPASGGKVQAMFMLNF